MYNAILQQFGNGILQQNITLPVDDGTVAPEETRQQGKNGMSWRTGVDELRRRQAMTAAMGGAELQGRYIAEGLAARADFEVHYLARRCLAEPAGDAYPITRIGDDRGVRKRAVFFDVLS